MLDQKTRPLSVLLVAGVRLSVASWQTVMVVRLVGMLLVAAVGWALVFLVVWHPRIERPAPTRAPTTLAPSTRAPSTLAPSTVSPTRPPRRQKRRRDELSLEAQLALYEAEGLVQTVATATAIGEAAGWGALGGPPARVGMAPPVRIDGVVFEAFALSHEAWVDSAKSEEMDVGLEPALAACARRDCGAVSYRVREGVATLYAKLRLKTGGQVKKRLLAAKRKARRVIWLYVKRGAALRHPALSEAKNLSSVFGMESLAHRTFAQGKKVARVVVSLTALPDRLAQMRPVLESLRNQTRPADEIRVHVPTQLARTGTAYGDVPRWLAQLATLVRVERDLGPATKLIPAVQKFRGDDDVLLVVVDDDTLYPPRLVETLVEWASRLDAAVAMTGWPVKRDLGYPHYTENYLVYANELCAPHPVAVVRGNCGFAVRPSYFDDRLWNDMQHAPPGATLMDDVWISGHLARRKVPRFVVPADLDQFTRSPRFTNVNTLDTNLGKHRAGSRTKKIDRRAANEAALRFFKGHWDVFWSPPRHALHF